MTNRKKKTKSRSKAVDARRDEGSSVLLSGIGERRRRRNHQYAQLLSFDPFTDAFDEILAHFDLLSRIEGLDPEIVHLLNDARDLVVTGVDSILSEASPHSVDEARKLLELEFLFHDFAGTPENLKEWSRLSHGDARTNSLSDSLESGTRSVKDLMRTPWMPHETITDCIVIAFTQSP